MLLPRHERTATVGVFGKSALSEIKNVCDTSKSSMRDWMVNPRYEIHQLGISNCLSLVAQNWLGSKLIILQVS